MKIGVRKINLIAVVAGAALLLLSSVNDAAARLETGLNSTASEAGFSTSPGSGDLVNVIGQLIRSAIGLTGVIFLVLTVYAGFLWMTAQGDSDKIEQARNIIKNCVIGIIIVAASYSITNFIFSSIRI